MSSALLGRILSLISRAGALYGDAAALTLLLAPVAAMLVFFVLRLVREKSRTAPRRWVLGFSGVCLFLFCALALANGEDLPASFALAFTAAAVHLLFYGLLFIPVSSRDARAAKRAERRRRRAPHRLWGRKRNCRPCRKSRARPKCAVFPTTTASRWKKTCV